MKVKKLVIFALILGLLTAGVAIAADPKPQTTCPVMGGKIDKSVYTDYQGQRIYFCCAACIPQFQKDPENYLKKMKEQGVTPEKTPAK
jgi:YHS domain-containing protein